MEEENTTQNIKLKLDPHEIKTLKDVRFVIGGLNMTIDSQALDTMDECETKTVLKRLFVTEEELAKRTEEREKTERETISQ